MEDEQVEDVEQLDYEGEDYVPQQPPPSMEAEAGAQTEEASQHGSPAAGQSGTEQQEAAVVPATDVADLQLLPYQGAKQSSWSADVSLASIPGYEQVLRDQLRQGYRDHVSSTGAGVAAGEHNQQQQRRDSRSKELAAAIRCMQQLNTQVAEPGSRLQHRSSALLKAFSSNSTSRFCQFHACTSSHDSCDCQAWDELGTPLPSEEECVSRLLPRHVAHPNSTNRDKVGGVRVRDAGLKQQASQAAAGRGRGRNSTRPQHGRGRSGRNRGGGRLMQQAAGQWKQQQWQQHHHGAAAAAGDGGYGGYDCYSAADAADQQQRWLWQQESGYGQRQPAYEDQRQWQHVQELRRRQQREQQEFELEQQRQWEEQQAACAVWQQQQAALAAQQQQLQCWSHSSSSAAAAAGYPGEGPAQTPTASGWDAGPKGAAAQPPPPPADTAVEPGKAWERAMKLGMATVTDTARQLGRAEAECKNSRRGQEAEKAARFEAELRATLAEEKLAKFERENPELVYRNVFTRLEGP